MFRPARCVAMSQLIFSLSAEATAAAAECSHEEEQKRTATRSSVTWGWACLCKRDLHENNKGLDSGCLHHSPNTKVGETDSVTRKFLHIRFQIKLSQKHNHFRLNYCIKIFLAFYFLLFYFVRSSRETKLPQC